MPYVDTQTIHNPATGTAIPAAWGDQTRDNSEFLIDPPFASVSHSATQVSVNGVGLALLANTELFDNNAMHSTVTNTSRITIQTAGRYKVAATVEFATDADGDRRLVFRVNGTTTHQSLRVSSSASTVILTGTRDLVLAATDYVEVVATQSAGNNLDVTLHEFSAMFVTR